MNGKQYAMEVHLVHKNDEGQLAVVGVLMQPGKPHTLLQTLVEQFPIDQSGESDTQCTYQSQGFLPT